MRTSLDCRPLDPGPHPRPFSPDNLRAIARSNKLEPGLNTLAPPSWIILRAGLHCQCARPFCNQSVLTSCNMGSPQIPCRDLDHSAAQHCRRSGSAHHGDSGPAPSGFRRRRRRSHRPGHKCGESAPLPRALSGRRRRAPNPLRSAPRACPPPIPGFELRGYFAACATFFRGTSSPASPATCPLTTAQAVTSRLTDGILTMIDFDTSRTIWPHLSPSWVK